MGNILITGFEPFGGMADNPSGRVAKSLDGRVIAGSKVVARQLPVSLARLDAAIDAALAAAGPKPSLVIALGVLPGHGFLKLERRAANRTDFSFEGADNDGYKPSSGVVEPGGPQSRVSTFDADKALAALNAKAIPARISDSAGFFICNATLYKLLARADTNACGFVHLPEASEQAAGRVSLPFQTIVDGIAAVCESQLAAAQPTRRRLRLFGASRAPAAAKPAARAKAKAVPGAKPKRGAKPAAKARKKAKPPAKARKKTAGKVVPAKRR